MPGTHLGTRGGCGCDSLPKMVMIGWWEPCFDHITSALGNLECPGWFCWVFGWLVLKSQAHLGFLRDPTGRICKPRVSPLWRRGVWQDPLMLNGSSLNGFTKMTAMAVTHER